MPFVSCHFVVRYGWWFRNPANQLRLVVYPIIYMVFIHPRWLALECVEPINSCHCCSSMISPFSEMAATKIWQATSLWQRGIRTGYQLSAAVMGNMPFGFSKPTCCDQPTRVFCCAGTVVLDVDAPSSASALGCLEQWCLFGVQLFYIDGVQLIYRIYKHWRCICGCCRSLHKLYNYGMFWLNGSSLPHLTTERPKPLIHHPSIIAGQMIGLIFWVHQGT